jgi:hypothetical protein
LSRLKMSDACPTAASAGESTDGGISRARHRVLRDTAPATARRTTLLSRRRPAPLSALTAYLARSSAIAMRLSAAAVGGASSRVLVVRAATVRGDWLGR